MSKPFSLGRGLSSLIPQKKDTDYNYWGRSESATLAPNSQSASDANQVIQIPTDSIHPNFRQPRKTFNDGPLQDLMLSVKTHGILQPLVARPDGAGKYELIAGERRLRAAQLAGLKTVPVIVREAHEQERLELALIENIQRENLNPLEEAHGYVQLHDEFGLTQEDIAKRVGKSRAQVANTLRLLDLPAVIQQALRDGVITMGHAKVILSLETPQEQVKFFESILEQGLNVRLAESKARSIKVRGHVRVSVNPSAEVAEWQRLLQQSLGTRVYIKGTTKGKVELEFYSPEELKELVQRIITNQ